MGKARLLLLIISVFCGSQGSAELYNGVTLAQVRLSDLAADVSPGTIVLLGENHGLKQHRDQHLEVLNILRKNSLKISVGLEFVNYTDQAVLNDYRQQKIDENEFLKAIGWAGVSFDFYRDQLNFPDPLLGEFSLGLNLPRAVVSHISRNGLESLTPDELALMPPQFTLGRDSYRRRFMEAAGVHCKNPENCFVAQCAWDDTMANTAVKFLEEHSDHVLVVVVGEFHVQYGGGLKHRILQRRPGTKVVSLSQIWAEDISDDDVRAAMQPSVEEGPRADFIWVSRP